MFRRVQDLVVRTRQMVTSKIRQVLHCEGWSAFLYQACLAFNGLDGHLATSASADLAADLKELAVMLRARMQNEVGAAQQVDLLFGQSKCLGPIRQFIG